MGKANVLLAGKFMPVMARFPYLASPKLDGVRAIIRDGKVYSRNLELIPNTLVQHLFGLSQFDGLDGELVVGNEHDAGTFNRTMSGVMSVHGEPAVQYRVFDDMSSNGTFAVRLANVMLRVRKAYKSCPISVVDHVRIADQAALTAYEEQMVSQGYEGVMVRDPNGTYKFGRSTVRENILLKVVQFETAEAEIVGFEEEMHNANDKVTNAMGVTKRRSLRVNMHGKGVLGKLLVRDLKTGVEFGVGSGLTAHHRQVLWTSRERLKGLVITYKYKPAGMKDKPRFPVFKGFRSPIDF